MNSTTRTKGKLTPAQKLALHLLAHNTHKEKAPWVWARKFNARPLRKLAKLSLIELEEKGKLIMRARVTTRGWKMLEQAPPEFDEPAPAPRTQIDLSDASDGD